MNTDEILKKQYAHVIDYYATPIWQEPDPDLAANRRRPVEQVTCGIMHTTGYGPGVRRLDKSDLSPEDIDLAYAQRLANMLQYKGHLFIGRLGGIWQMMPLWYRGHHTTSKGHGAYLSDKWKRRKNKPMEWWAPRFANMKSPIELPAWRVLGTKKVRGKKVDIRSPNKVSWGIDFLAPKPKDTYTEAQYRSGAKVVVQCARICSHPIDDLHITTHSDAHPLDRTNKYGPWDLGTRWDREKFWRMVREEIARTGLAS